MFDLDAFDGHAEVVHVAKPGAGLRAILAIHDTTLGPALGGVRMRAYGDGAAATSDALRLARGMTFKNALAGLPFGGGKSVILGDPHRHKTPALLDAFADAVDALSGRYVAAEDMGITEADARHMRTRTPHVCGTGLSGVGGDPSPKTARGVFRGVEAAVRFAHGRSDLEGLRVAVQGLGAVGFKLAGLLAGAGARLVVADIDRERVARARESFGAETCAVDAIHAADVDVFAPCALGACLHQGTIPSIRARVVAGAANNQLETAADGDRLAARGIVYAPDFVINAGGVIAVAHEHLGHVDEERTWAKVDGIASTLGAILERAQRQGLTPERAAEAEALARLGRTTPPAKAA